MNLKQTRVNCRLTQDQVAGCADVTYQLVYQWERGKTFVAKNHWGVLARLFHINEDELERILVDTIYDACVASGDNRQLLLAQNSRLYKPELIADAIARFGSRTRGVILDNAISKSNTFEQERLRYEREILEKDKRIFELEKEVDELKRKLKELRGE